MSKKRKDVSVKVAPRARQKIEDAVRSLNAQQGALNTYIGGLKDALPTVGEDWLFDVKAMSFRPPEKKED